MKELTLQSDNECVDDRLVRANGDLTDLLNVTELAVNDDLDEAAIVVAIEDVLGGGVLHRLTVRLFDKRRGQFHWCDSWLVYSRYIIHQPLGPVNREISDLW